MMRNGYGVLFGLMLAVFTLPVAAQTPPTNSPPVYQWIPAPVEDSVVWDKSYTLMPLSFLGAGLEGAYESYKPANKTSYRVNAGVFLATTPYFYDNYDDYFGFRVEVQKRFHLIKTTYQKNGCYLAPYAQLKYINLHKKGNPSTFYNQQTTKETAAFGLGVLFGYQVRYATRFVFDMYLGGGLILPTNNAAADVASIAIINPYNRGISVHGGIGLGLLGKPRK